MADSSIERLDDAAVAEIPSAKERSILFTAEMVNAILNGSKTMTRRVMNPQPSEDWTPYGEMNEVHKMVDGEFVMRRGAPVVIGHGYSNYDGDEGYACPYGKPGDRLYARETYRLEKVYDGHRPVDVPDSRVWYCADQGAVQYRGLFIKGRKRPSIHMPRWASRIMRHVQAGEMK